MRIATDLGPRTIVQSNLAPQDASLLAAQADDDAWRITDDGPSFTYLEWRKKQQAKAKFAETVARRKAIKSDPNVIQLKRKEK